MSFQWRTRTFTPDRGAYVAWYVDASSEPWSDTVAGWLVQDEYETDPYNHPGTATGGTRVVAAIIVEAELEPAGNPFFADVFVGLYPPGVTPPADELERAGRVAARVAAQRQREQRGAATRKATT